MNMNNAEVSLLVRCDDIIIQKRLSLSGCECDVISVGNFELSREVSAYTSVSYKDKAHKSKSGVRFLIQDWTQM